MEPEQRSETRLNLIDTIQPGTRKTLLSSVREKEQPPPPQPLLYVPMRINGTMHYALVESGASNSFISQKVVDNMGLKKHALIQSLNVKVDNVQVLTARYFVTIDLYFVRHNLRLLL